MAERMQAGQATRVPKLKQSHIVRDSWTRLNVLPSKVMQVNKIINITNRNNIYCYLRIQQDEVFSELRECFNKRRVVS